MVLTLLPNGIDLLLTEKQSMAQIVCNELAQLTWQSSSDLFVFRLTHLRDLSESWRQFDVSKSLTPLVANNTIEQPIVRAINKAGMLTRSKSISKSKSVPLSVTKGETTTRSKLNDSGRKSNSRSFKSIPRSSESASKENTNDVDMTSLVENTAHTDVSELTQNDEDEASTKVLNQSSESVDGLTSDSRISLVQYDCTECELSFSRLSSLFRHLKHDHSTNNNARRPATNLTGRPPPSSGSFVCKTCGRSFANKLKLLIHCHIHRSMINAKRAAKRKLAVKTELEDCGNTCPVCDRKFLYKRCLLRHQQQLCIQKPVVTSPVVDWLKLDESAAKEISEARYFQCTECDDSFDRIDDLCWHIRVHCLRSHKPCADEVRIGNFQCTICDRQFMTEFELSAHNLKNADAHECLECDRRIGSALQLRIHMLIHRADSKSDGESANSPAMPTVKHECPVCLKVSKSASQLSDHMVVHSGMKKHICHVCAKQFARSGQLKRHILSHNGDRRFECAKCNKRFLLRDMLQRHTRAVHEKQRPHLCSHCGRPFAMKHQLRTHMKIHVRSLTSNEVE